MAVVAIIPARYGSTRLPGKPLANIGGKPMIQHVYESTLKARGLDRVLVATDDRRVAETVQGFGGEVVMTSKDHASGTDRLAEVARKIKVDWLVNVQGDLPFIQPETITRAVQPMRRDRSIRGRSRASRSASAAPRRSWPRAATASASPARSTRSRRCTRPGRSPAGGCS